MIREILGDKIPEPLLRISSPPHQLYAVGADLSELLARPRVAIVGSRKMSSYGRQITSQLAADLAAQGIVIISGLAYGVDARAHTAALEVKGLALAVLAGGLDAVYPTVHTGLARKILNSGGAIISEYPVGTPPFKQNFIARNRLVAGLANALLITEAAEQSGTLHTARFALDQGIDVLAVPGNITSPTSAGTNNLIKAGARPITCLNDVLHALGLAETSRSAKAKKRILGANSSEQHIIDSLEKGTTDGAELLAESNLSVAEFNYHLTMLELTSKIRSLGNNHWALG